MVLGSRLILSNNSNSLFWISNPVSGFK